MTTKLSLKCFWKLVPTLPIVWKFPNQNLFEKCSKLSRYFPDSLSFSLPLPLPFLLALFSLFSLSLSSLLYFPYSPSLFPPCSISLILLSLLLLPSPIPSRSPYLLPATTSHLSLPFPSLSFPPFHHDYFVEYSIRREKKLINNICTF